MKKVIILLLCLALTLAGCTDSETDSKDNTQEGSKDWDLSKLVGSSSSYKCTARIQHAGKIADMDIWVKGNNEKIEIQTDEGLAHMLYQGKVLHQWAEGKSDGIKMDFEVLTGDASPNTGAQSVEQYNRNAVNLDCKKASVPSSKFNIPSNVNFRDMTKMFERFTN